MAFLDLFKKKKAKKVAEKKEPKKEVAVKPAVKPKLAPKKTKEVDASVYNTINHQHVTEKATGMSSLNKYVFRVFDNANKPAVKKAVEKLHNVRVDKVNIINVPSKKVRLGKHEGVKGGYKKAIVTLREGYKIEIAPS